MGSFPGVLLDSFLLNPSRFRIILSFVRLWNFVGFLFIEVLLDVNENSFLCNFYVKTFTMILNVMHASLPGFEI
jgi:hypothetical protein